MRLSLKGIKVNCILGDLPKERDHEQQIEIDLELEIDDKSAQTDCLEDTVDYVLVATRVGEVLKAAKCRLIERAAKLVAETACEFEQIRWVEARIRKFGTLPFVESVSATFSQSHGDLKG